MIVPFGTAVPVVELDGDGPVGERLPGAAPGVIGFDGRGVRN
jgi:hypothetical protein